MGITIEDKNVLGMQDVDFAQISSFLTKFRLGFSQISPKLTKFSQIPSILLGDAAASPAPTAIRMMGSPSAKLALR